MKRLLRASGNAVKALVVLAVVLAVAAVVLILALRAREPETPVFVPLSASQGLTDSLAAEEVLVRGDWGYPPFEYLNDAGEPDGFNVDILTRIGEIMGIDVRISLGPWDEVRGEIERGEIDALAGMYRTEERDERVDFSIPHFISSYGVFVPDDSDIRSTDDIGDRRILVQAQDLGHDYLVENDIGAEIVTVDEWESVLPALADDEADCAVMGMVQGMRLLRDEGFRNVRALSEPLLQRSYCIAVREGDRELLQLFNEGLNLLKTSGEYDEIYEEWFGIYESRTSVNPTLVRALAAGILVLALVLIAIALWTHSLRRQVHRQTASLWEAMEQLEQANETKDRFLAGVSHELRTPLHGIMGMVELMEKTDLDSEQAELTGTMKTATGQLHRVLSDLIDISRIESGKLSLEASAFSLGDLTDWIAPTLSGAAQEKGLGLEISVDGDRDTTLVADKERIVQVILNLADNAIKNTDTGGVDVRIAHEARAAGEHEVEGEAAGNDGAITVRVRDTGRGISPSDHRRIISAFTQLEDSTGALTPGLGLGLSIVKSITELMGGSIDVESVPEEGTTFAVRLPVAGGGTPRQRERTVEGAETAAVRGQTSGRVLIAEDEAINRLYLEHLLAAHGWETTAATDGEEALEQLAVGAFDLVFMDLSMPRVGGLEATRRHRERESGSGSARTPVIALTAHAYRENRQECIDAGMDGFVTKPFSENALWREIERVTGHGRSGPRV